MARYSSPKTAQKPIWIWACLLYTSVVLLDLKGKSYSSEQLADQLQQIFSYQGSQIAFVIGGSLGVSPEVIARADLRWKMSDLTFPHQLCRLLVLEQIYRSFRILNHEPYHK